MVFSEKNAEHKLFAENISLEDNISANSITLSFDLNCNYKTRNKETNTYLDVQKIDSNLNIITAVELSYQIIERMERYVQIRSKAPDMYFIKLIATNQAIRKIAGFEQRDDSLVIKLEEAISL